MELTTIKILISDINLWCPTVFGFGTMLIFIHILIHNCKQIHNNIKNVTNRYFFHLFLLHPIK